MREHSRNLFPSGVTLGLIVTAFLFVALGTAVAQRKGNGGGGGGGTTSTGWVDDFNTIDSTRWVKATAQTPTPGNTPSNTGTYDPNYVGLVQAVDGNTYLQIKLTQKVVSTEPSVTSSTGGLLYSNQTYRYGTYEWRMRMSSTATEPFGSGVPQSGNVSAAFNYVNNSQTEVDFEFSGHVIGDLDLYNDNTLYMANWNNKGPKSPPAPNELTSSTTEIPGITSGFKTYRFVWEEGKITFCVEGSYQTHHTTDVPSAPANLMINHWGTNKLDGGFGGKATPGITRYFYVDRVGFTPLLLGCSEPFRLP